MAIVSNIRRAVPTGDAARASLAPSIRSLRLLSVLILCVLLWGDNCSACSFGRLRCRSGMGIRNSTRLHCLRRCVPSTNSVSYFYMVFQTDPATGKALVVGDYDQCAEAVDVVTRLRKAKKEAYCVRYPDKPIK